MARPATNLEPYKARIISLYRSNRTIDAIFHILLQEHNFHTSTRTIWSRLRAWGICKRQKTDDSPALRQRISALYHESHLSDKDMLRTLQQENYTVQMRAMQRIRRDEGIKRISMDGDRGTVSSPPILLRGGCFCARVTYISSALPKSTCACFCITCRQVSGAPFLVFGNFDNRDLRWNAVSEDDVHLVSSSVAIRGFCGKCGTSLFMKYHCQPSRTHVTVGSVDEESVVGEIPRTKEHIFLSQKVKWWGVEQDEELEMYERFDDSFQKVMEEWEANGSKPRTDAGIA